MNRDFGLVVDHAALNPDSLAVTESALDQTGIRRVVLPAVAPPARTLNLLGGDLRVATAAGGWLLPPGPAHFESTRIAPRSARARGVEQALPRLQALGLRLTGRVSLRSAPGVADYAPAQQRSAWGDVWHGRACVSNPDVRAALRATLRDLRRVEPVGFEIADWTLDAPAAGEPPLLAWNAVAARLLNLCFCESCRQIALDSGADPDPAARSVRVHFERALRADANDSTVDPADDPVIAAYCEARDAANAAWLEALAGEHDGVDRLWIESGAAAPPGWAAIDDLAAPDFGANPAAHDLEAVVSSRLARRPQPRGLQLPVWRPWLRDAATLIRALDVAIQAGVTYFDFAGLSQAPPEAAAWLAQAVRFARRR